MVVKKTRIYILLLIALSLLVSFSVSAEETAIISGSEVSVKAGETASVAVSIENNTGISAFLLDIGFDSELFTLDSVEFNDEFAVDGFSFWNEHLVMWANEKVDENGELRPYDTDFTGVMFVLKFTVSEDAPVGDYPVDISLAAAADGDDEQNVSNAAAEPVAVTFSSGIIHVIDDTVQPSATATATPVVTETPTASPSATATATPVVTEAPTASPSATATATPVVTEAPTAEPGDDKPDEVVVVDVQLISEPSKIEYIVGEGFTAYGAVIREFYSDGTYKDVLVTVDMCSGFDTSVSGDQTVVVKYGDFVFDFEILVEEANQPLGDRGFSLILACTVAFCYAVQIIAIRKKCYKDK